MPSCKHFNINFWHENCSILIHISLNFAITIDTSWTLVQVIAWARIGDKQLLELNMAKFAYAYMYHPALVSSWNMCEHSVALSWNISRRLFLIVGIYFGTPDVLFGMTLYRWRRWCWRWWCVDGHDKRLTSEPLPVQMQIGKEHLSSSTHVVYKFIYQMCWYFLPEMNDRAD